MERRAAQQRKVRGCGLTVTLSPQITHTPVHSSHKCALATIDSVSLQFQMSEVNTGKWEGKKRSFDPKLPWTTSRIAESHYPVSLFGAQCCQTDGSVPRCLYNCWPIIQSVFILKQSRYDPHTPLKMHAALCVCVCADHGNTAEPEMYGMRFVISNCITLSITFILFCTNCRACRTTGGRLSGFRNRWAHLLRKYYRAAEGDRNISNNYNEKYSEELGTRTRSAPL